MGGNIFDQNRRATSKQYEEVVRHVRDVLGASLNAQSMCLPYFRKKESFGDVDIIVEMEKICFPQDEDRFQRLKDTINSHFHSNDLVHVNDTVVSFLYRKSPNEATGIQVDLLATPHQDMAIARDYFSYNDLGNLMGRIAHKMGLSFGHRGLLYTVREGSHVHETIVISQDTSVILPFLGYDYSRFQKGFDTIEEVFEFVVSSPFFNKDIYLLENRNHTSRTRDRKRPNYRGFLEYIEKVCPSHYEFPEDKNTWISRVNEFFPNFSTQLLRVGEKITERKNNKVLFNGDLVKEITGCQGEELGKVMGTFSARFANKQKMWDYIKHNPEKWKKDIQDIAQQQTNPRAKNGL